MVRGEGNFDWPNLGHVLISVIRNEVVYLEASLKLHKGVKEWLSKKNRMQFQKVGGKRYWPSEKQDVYSVGCW